MIFVGFSSSDGNGEGHKSNQWFNPSSHKTVHGFDLSQVEDLEDIDHLNGGRNGATVTGKYENLPYHFCAFLIILMLIFLNNRIKLFQLILLQTHQGILFLLVYTLGPTLIWKR